MSKEGTRNAFSPSKRGQAEANAPRPWLCHTSIYVDGTGGTACYATAVSRSGFKEGEVKFNSDMCINHQRQRLSRVRNYPPPPLPGRNADAEDQLYGTWDPLTHFTEDGPVPAYVSMVERFAKEIDEEGLLDEDAAAGGAAA